MSLTQVAATAGLCGQSQVIWVVGANYLNDEQIYLGRRRWWVNWRRSRAWPEDARSQLNQKRFSPADNYERLPGHATAGRPIRWSRYDEHRT
jgi:hypothetical protein